jgi:hypothetical protein
MRSNNNASGGHPPGLKAAISEIRAILTFTFNLNMQLQALYFYPLENKRPSLSCQSIIDSFSAVFLKHEMCIRVYDMELS